jgi:uncharacterized membrane protein
MVFLDKIFDQFKKINNTYYLIGVCIFAIIIRAIGVDPLNLSIEEAEFFYYSHPSMSIDELFMACRRGLPIFDFFLYRIWFSLIGFSIIKGKALSFLFNIALIPLVYALSKKIKSSELEARFSAFLVVISLSFISLANVPRFYNEVLLLSTLSFYFFIDFLKQKVPITSIICYILFTSLTILAHYFFAFIFVTQGIIGLIFYLKKQISKTNFILGLVSFISISLIIALVFSTFIYLLKSGNEYLSETNTPFIVFAHLYIFLGQDPILFITCLLLFITYIISFFKTNKKPNYNKIVIVLWLLLTLVIPILVDILYKPIIRRDYHLILFIPFLMIVSWGFNVLKNNWKVTIICLIICSGIINICYVQNYYTDPENTLYRTPYRFGNLSYEITKKSSPSSLIFVEQEIPYNLYFCHVWKTNYRATSDSSKLNLLSDTIVNVIKHKDKIINDDNATNTKVNSSFIIIDSVKIKFDAFYVYKIASKSN